jgi:hypothetical protein
VTTRTRAQSHETGGAAGELVDGEEREARLVYLAAEIRELRVRVEKHLPHRARRRDVTWAGSITGREVWSTA